jgi:ubiquinol oxidase
MYSVVGLRSSALSSKAAAAKLAQATQDICHSGKRVTFASPVSYVFVQQNLITQRRHFSATTRTQLEVFPPPVQAPNVKVTAPAWRHPVYTVEQMNSIKVAHRDAKTWSDYVALSMVRVLRFGMDLCTGYTHDKVSTGEQDIKNPKKGFYGPMDERKWLTRFVFLESVAGVPGMVAGMLRHLHSIRRLRRDNGW